MAVNPKITITADDQTKAAFQSVKKNLAALELSANRMSGAMSGLKNLATGGALLGFAAGVGRAVDSSMKAADSIGDLSAASGIATETLSVLKGAAEKSGQSLETMGKGLKGLSKFMDSLRSGDQGARTIMKRLGLDPDEMAKLGNSEAGIKKLATAFASFSGDRMAMGMKIFGKAGVDMIEIMDNLANKGFDEIKKKMEYLGTVVTPEAAAAANQYNEDLSALQSRSESAAREFGTGLVPALNDVTKWFMEATKGSGSFFKTLGEYAGYSLKMLSMVGYTVYKAILMPFKQVESLLKIDLMSTSAKDWSKAFSLPLDEFQMDISTKMKSLFGPKNEAPKSGGDKDKDEMGPSGSPGGNKSNAMAGDLAALERSYNLGLITLDGYLSSRLALIKKYGTDEAKMREDRIKALNDYDRKAWDEEKKRLEERKLETEKREKAMDEVSKATEELAKDQEDIRKRQVDMAQFEIEALDRKEKMLGIDIEAGRLTKAEESEARMSLLEEKASLLEEIAKNMRMIGVAAGDVAMIQFAENLSLQVYESKAHLEVLRNEWAGVRESITGSFESGLTDFFTDLITGAKNLSDAFRAMGQTIVAEIARILAAKAAAGLVNSATNSGFWQYLATGVAMSGNAEGGYISGPGTGTSDSIVTRLSNGEYVIKASSVKRLGVPFLNTLNYGPGVKSSNRFATGGLVEPSRGASTSSQVDMVVGLDDGLILRQLNSSAGVKALVEVMSKNRKAFGQALR